MESGSWWHEYIEHELQFACASPEPELEEEGSVNLDQLDIQNEAFEVITITPTTQEQNEDQEVYTIANDNEGREEEEGTKPHAAQACGTLPQDEERGDTLADSQSESEEGESEEGESDEEESEEEESEEEEIEDQEDQAVEPVVGKESELKEDNDKQMEDAKDIDTSDDSQGDDKYNEEGEWVSFEVPQADEDVEEFKVQYSESLNRKLSAGSEDMSLSSDGSSRQQVDETTPEEVEEEVSFDSSSPSAQLQIAVQQNSVQRKTIKQLQNAIINLQEDCATYEQKFMQVKQEGEKMYMTLFAKAARVKELTKKNEALEEICSMKDQMIYNQKLHIDEYKMTTNTKTLEVAEWQTRFDRANDAYQQALIDIDSKDAENSELIAKITELESALEIQSGLRESSHAVAQANVQILAEKDAEILSLTEKLNDATRELTSIVAYVQSRGDTGLAKKETSTESLEEMLEAQRSRITELEELLAAKDADVRASEAIASEASERCSQKEKEIEELKAEVQKVVAEVVKVTGSADELAHNFHAQIAKAQEDIAERDAEIAALRANMEELARPTTPMDQDSETEVVVANNRAAEQLAELQQTKDELTKLEEEFARTRDALAAMEENLESERTNFRTEKEELSNAIAQIEEAKQKEISELLVKLQLASEMTEMKVAASAPPPPKQVCEVEIQTDPVSSSYRRVSGQQSNSVLMEQLEAIQISNELLRGDNASIQKKLDKLQEAHAAMQVRMREAEAKSEMLVAQIRANKEAEEEKRNSLIFEHTEEKAHLEMTIQELLEKQSSAMEDQQTVAEAKVAIERERTLHAKLTEQTAINQNLQNDLRLLYLKHKKDLADIEEEYKHEQYKQRYMEVVVDRNSKKKELDALHKVVQRVMAMQAKGGLIEAQKENVNTMNQQYQVQDIKLGQLKAFQAFSADTVTKLKQLEKQLAEQKAETQKLVEQKESDVLAWNVRRTEWENLCAKIVKERDSMKADNERAAAISARFEGMLKAAGEETQALTAEISKLKDNNSTLQETVDFLEVQITSHEETVAQLESQLRESQEQLTVKGGELTASREECANAMTLLESARAEVAQLMGEIKSLHVKTVLDSVVSKAEIVACKRNEKILNERINQLNLTITNYETLAQKEQDQAVISLTAQVSQLNTEITKLSQEVSLQTGEALKWSRAHKELSQFVEDERTIKDEQLQEAEDKSRDLDARLQEQLKQNADLVVEKQTLEYELKLLHETNEEIQQEVENGKKALQEAQDETIRISQERDSMLDNIATCTKSAAGLQEAFDKRYEEMLLAKKQFEEALNEKLLEEKERSQKAECELHEKLLATKTEKEILSAKISELDNQLADSESKIGHKCELVKSLQDELSVFAECLTQKEKAVEDLSAKLQALIQANTQKETELSVQENEKAMKVSQLQSELEIARSQVAQLQTENARLKKNVSEVTAQSMAVNSRHLDSATKLRESIAHLTERADKSAKDLEAAETQLAELRASKVALERANAELTEKLSTTEKAKQVSGELDLQIKKLTDELKLKNSKFDEISAKLVACTHHSNGLTNRVKELTAEKVSQEQDLAVAQESQAKLLARISSLEVTTTKDKEKIDKLQQSCSTSMANESKLESELRKAVGSIRALRNEKDKIASQLEQCLANSNDQEQSAILRVKFSLEREVVALTALNDSAKHESARLMDEMARYKASVTRFKERMEDKMQVQAGNLQKAEEEVKALETFLKQLQTIITRHETFFARAPELSQLYLRLTSMLGAHETPAQRPSSNVSPAPAAATHRHLN
eukprot:Phypoly_transcript_00256.p1 GENE.Phypoly_transcript_00256~~Phypoly_transcript_00256.p1  ORF type:complete len:1799 (+),score=500.24 Phypoly_transcript_00256:31-5397(+)